MGHLESRGHSLRAGFMKGWLEARDVEVSRTRLQRPARAGRHRRLGGPEAPVLVFHGHLDVVPRTPSSSSPRIEGDQLIGRGAYDMKGALAAMMCATRELCRTHGREVHFVCVSDEESDETELRASDWLVKHGYVGTSPSRASPPTCTSACRRRACWRCA